MFVVSFRFLSGSSMTFTYGSDVPDRSLAASSVALMIRRFSVSVCNHSRIHHNYDTIIMVRITRVRSLSRLQRASKETGGCVICPIKTVHEMT